MDTNRKHARPRSRRGSFRWQVLAFLLAFVALLMAVLAYCIVPGMEAAKHATDQEKQHLVAWFRLLLAVLLLILFCGLLLTFRVSRFFLPRSTPPRSRTVYTDAWEESARRMPTPPPEDELNKP